MRSVRTQPDKFKTRRRTRAHFSAFVAALALLALLGGCAQVPARDRSGMAPEQPLARLDLPVGGADGRASALVIAAEFALQNNQVDKAAADYAEAAQISNDPAVAKRALQLALATHDAASAQKLLDRWQALGADAHNLAAVRAQLAMLRGDRADAEHQYRLLLASGKTDDWKTFAATLLTARDTALAGRVLEDLATPERLPANESIWVALSQLGEHLGRHVFARKLADAAVQRFDAPDAIRWAASLRVTTGDRAGAIALYAKGVAAHPRNVELRLG